VALTVSLLASWITKVGEKILPLDVKKVGGEMGCENFFPKAMLKNENFMPSSPGKPFSIGKGGTVLQGKSHARGGPIRQKGKRGGEW